MYYMNKICKSYKVGDSTVISLTGFIDLGKEYFVHNDGNKVIVEPIENLIKS